MPIFEVADACVLVVQDLFVVEFVSLFINAHIELVETLSITLKVWQIRARYKPRAQSRTVLASWCQGGILEKEEHGPFVRTCPICLRLCWAGSIKKLVSTTKASGGFLELNGSTACFFVG